MPVRGGDAAGGAMAGGDGLAERLWQAVHPPQLASSWCCPSHPALPSRSLC